MNNDDDGDVRGGMNDPELQKKSKKLSWLLRHGANESGLAMDTAGFADVDAVLQQTGLSRAELDVVVAENNKSRFEVRPSSENGASGAAKGERMRAVQGHSLDGTPVTLEGLEASWQVVDDDAPLFHGTAAGSARFILLDEAGIHSAARSHVHLAAAVDATVGKRAGVDVLLTIDPVKLRAAGQRIFRAPNGVLLTRAVPRSCVVDVVAQNKPGRNAHAELLSLLVR